MATFTISLTNVRFYAFHGVLKQEARIGNEFILDLDLSIDATDIETTVEFGEEDLDRTISYADVYETVRTEMSKRRLLLETLAINIAKALRHRYPHLLGGRIRIAKATPPIPGIDGSTAVTYQF